MNDFTLAELNDIAEAVDQYYKGDMSAHGEQLLMKIIKMKVRKCDSHQWLTDHRMKFMSNPPQYKLICAVCGASRYMECSKFDRGDNE